MQLYDCCNCVLKLAAAASRVHDIAIDTEFGRRLQARLPVHVHDVNIITLSHREIIVSIMREQATLLSQQQELSRHVAPRQC